MFSLDKIRQNKMNKVNITNDRKQYFKDYYKKNKERMLTNSKQFYLDNRDEINKNRKGKQNEYYRQYYRNHKEYYIKRNRTEEVKVKQRISSLKHYYKNREVINEQRRQKYHETKPPPKPKKPAKPKPPKVARIKLKNGRVLLKKPNLSNYIYTDDGSVILRF